VLKRGEAGLEKAKQWLTGALLMVRTEVYTGYFGLLLD
jgi:hypothetical protein